MRVRHKVTAVDLANRTVTVRTLETGDEFAEPFDQLLFATGSLPLRPDLPGLEAEGIFGLANVEDGIRLTRFLDDTGAREAVVVGGGYVGLEMAEALLNRGLTVALVGRGAQAMGTLDPDMGALVSAALRKAGVAVYLAEDLEGFDVSGGRVRAVVTGARRLDADLVVLGMGIRPNSDLAAAAGLQLGERGSIEVDRSMRTGVDGVWAAGDCAETYHLVSRRPVWMALATIANKMGLAAGVNIAGGGEVFPGVVGTAATKICEVEVARTGLKETEIQALGLKYATATIESSTRAHYYPGAGKITVKVLAEKGSGRLLGGQIVGYEGAAKRIDVLAMALHAGMNVGDMIDLDLSYAPPFSPVWDPVLLAARDVARRV